MSLNNDIKAIYEKATSLFPENTLYVAGDDEETVKKKRDISAKKAEWKENAIKEAVIDTIQALITLTNSTGNDVIVDGLLQGSLSGTHRELQRMFFQENLIPFLIKYADTVDDNAYTDPRNQRIKELLKDMLLPYNYLNR